MRPIDEIVIHCSATPKSWMNGISLASKVMEIRSWHVGVNKWSDIGYHFLIDRDGALAEGRPLEKIGAHVRGRNKTTIGVCLIGGGSSSADDRFEEHFTQAQDRALRQLLADLRKRFGPLKVSGHNQYAAKACPGFYVPDWYQPAPAARSPFWGFWRHRRRA